MRLVFETKQTKTADEVREWIISNLGVNCSVEVHPSNTIINLQGDVEELDLDKLYDWMKEEMDGRLITPVGGGKETKTKASEGGWLRR